MTLEQLHRRDRVHYEIIQALVKDGFERQVARTILDALTHGNIPHVKIDYDE